MTISTTTNRVSYAGNGVTTAFSFPYYFINQNDLTIILRVDATGVETTKTITTHYTVAGAGVQAGGTITMLTAPASGETLVILRDPDQTQELDLVENDQMPAESIEQTFDKNVMLAQRLQDQIDRAIKLSEGFTSSFDTTLPELLPSLELLRINSTGDGLDTVTVEEAAFDAQIPTTTKGDLIVHNGTVNVRLGVGTNDKVLAADSTATEGVAYKTLRALLGTTTKGDLLIDTGSALSRRAVGSNYGQSLGVDATHASGLSYFNDVKAITSKTATYLATLADHMILCSGTSFTVTLPTAVGNTGKVFIFKKTDAPLTGIFTVDGDGSETIDGSATTTLGIQNETLRIVSDGTNWQILERSIPNVWTSYTPTYTGFGTVTVSTAHWRREGSDLIIQGRFTVATSTATEARLSLPSGLSSLSFGSSTLLAGNAVFSDADANQCYILTESGTTYVCFGSQDVGRGGLNKINGNSTASAGREIGFLARIPIQGWN